MNAPQIVSLSQNPIWICTGSLIIKVLTITVIVFFESSTDNVVRTPMFEEMTLGGGTLYNLQDHMKGKCYKS